MPCMVPSSPRAMNESLHNLLLSLTEFDIKSGKLA